MPNLQKNPNEQHRSSKLLLRIVIFYPLVIAIIYFIFIAQDRYASISKISVKKSENAADSSFNLGLLTGSTSPSAEDALYLKEYIESAGMMEHLDTKIGLRRAFADSGLDILYGLPLQMTKESFLRYYQQRINVIFDSGTNLLSIETQGFTPIFALKFNLAILEEAERFINELAHTIVREQMNFAEQAVNDSYAKLTKSKEAILQYQNKYGFLDPISQAESSSRMIMEMEAHKVQLETELRTQLTYLKENTPQIVSARNTLASLNKQIEQERAKIVAPKGIQLNTLASQFQSLKGKLDFDTAIYGTAMSAVEKTRIEVLRKLKVLSIIVAPQQPEEAEYPHALYMLLSLFIGLSLLYGTLRLIISIIDDHRD